MSKKQGVEVTFDAGRLVFMEPDVLGAEHSMEADMARIKNMTYAPPTQGRISIGEKVERNGKNLPQKLNHFMVTTHYQHEGKFVAHTIMKAIAEKTSQDVGAITFIPIQLAYNDVDLNVRQRFEAFDPKGRIMCAGDGEHAKRKVNDKIEDATCPGAETCAYGKQAKCKLSTRMNVKIDVPEPEGMVKDDLSSFMLRSSGFNTAKALVAKLDAIHALLGGRLVGVPLKLQLRKKSSAASFQSSFYYVDLVLSETLEASMALAKGHADKLASLGIDQEAFEAAARAGLANSPFGDATEDDIDFMESDAMDESLGDKSEAESGEASSAPVSPALAAGAGDEFEDPMAWIGQVTGKVKNLQDLNRH